MCCFFLNKIYSSYIFIFNIILTISFIIKRNDINFILFIFLIILNILGFYFSIIIISKKHIQNYIKQIQFIGLLIFLYHSFSLILFILEKYNNDYMILFGLLSIISNILLCLNNYGYKRIFINYNYDAEQNNQREENSNECDDPEIPEEQIGELSIEINQNTYDNEFQFYPSAPPLNSNEEIEGL